MLRAENFRAQKVICLLNKENDKLTGKYGQLKEILDEDRDEDAASKKILVLRKEIDSLKNLIATNGLEHVQLA